MVCVYHWASGSSQGTWPGKLNRVKLKLHSQSFLYCSRPYTHFWPLLVGGAHHRNHFDLWHRVGQRKPTNCSVWILVRHQWLATVFWCLAINFTCRKVAQLAIWGVVHIGGWRMCLPCFSNRILPEPPISHVSTKELFARACTIAHASAQNVARRL